MKILTRVLLAWLVACVCTAQASPALWYKYQSLKTGVYICTQVDPGEHFVRFAGPFKNAACR